MSLFAYVLPVINYSCTNLVHILFLPFSAYAKGQQISKLVDESFVPINECTEEELLQFAERFLEWAMINKEIYDSDDPASLDLEGLVNQARLLGFTSLEKTEILTVRIESSSDECKLFALYGFDHCVTHWRVRL